jgi:hypothetical protein
MQAIDSPENAAIGNLIGTPDDTVMGTIYWHSNGSDILMGNIIGASNGADMGTMVGTPDCPEGADLDTNKIGTPVGVDMGMTTIDNLYSASFLGTVT